MTGYCLVIGVSTLPLPIIQEIGVMNKEKEQFENVEINV
jgi:uncharacterized membrane protein (Fun14 family)